MFPVEGGTRMLLWASVSLEPSLEIEKRKTIVQVWYFACFQYVCLCMDNITSKLIWSLRCEVTPQYLHIRRMVLKKLSSRSVVPKLFFFRRPLLCTSRRDRDPKSVLQCIGLYYTNSQLQLYFLWFEFRQNSVDFFLLFITLSGFR